MTSYAWRSSPAASMYKPGLLLVRLSPPLIIYHASKGFEVVVQELVRIQVELRTAAGRLGSPRFCTGLRSLISLPSSNRAPGSPAVCGEQCLDSAIELSTSSEKPASGLCSAGPCLDGKNTTSNLSA
jgi:hypothetical protein